jgi:hypothetical protein
MCWAAHHPPAQVVAAARSADKHYSDFLASYDSGPGSGSGPGPQQRKRLDPEEEPHYLSACFSIGRAAAKLDPSNAG